MRTITNNLFVINQWLIILFAFSIPLSTSLTSIFLLLFIVSWFIEGNYTEKMRLITSHRIFCASWLVFLILLLATSYSIASWPEINKYLQKMHKLLYMPLFIPYLQSKTIRQKILAALLLSASITIILGILVFHKVMPNPVATISHNPTTWLFKNTIDTALFITLITFILLQLSYLWSKMNTTIKTLYIISITTSFLFLYIYCTARTSHILFLGLIGIFCLQKLRFKLAIFVAPLTVIILCLIINSITTNFSSRLELTSQDLSYYKKHTIEQKPTQSTTQRLQYYKNSMQLVQTRPWLGFGTGSFVRAYSELAKQQQMLFTTNPHNEYLNFAVQLGFGGFILLLWFFMVLYRASTCLPVFEKRLLQGVLFTFSVGCLANSWLMDFMPGHLFALLVIFCLAPLANQPSTKNLC